MPAAEHGFTLIELMVVITIIALTSTAVVMTLPDGSAKLREDAQRFAARVSGARDQAILASRPMAVSVGTGGYSFQRREHGRWQPLEDKPFATTPWRDGVTAAAPTRIVFDSTGASDDQARIVLIRDGAQVGVIVNADGKVAVGG